MPHDYCRDIEGYAGGARVIEGYAATLRHYFYTR